MKLPTPVKLKSGAYRIRLRLGGKEIPVYGETEAKCRKAAELLKIEHATGKVVQKRCDYTTKQAIEAYIASRQNRSPSTIRSYETIKKNRFQSVMDKVIDTVDWQAAINAEECAPKTLKSAWGLISSAMRFIQVPVPDVELPSIIPKERPFLEPEDIPVFLDAIYGTSFELAALFGLHSLRRSEICDLTMRDIDLKKQIIYVRGAAVPDKDNKIVHKAENKNSASNRVVPIMIPRLTELLTQMQKDGVEGYLVPHHPNSIYKAVNSVCSKNGLPETGCHGLRHSFISLAYHLKWSALATMRVAGYSDYNTMRKIYTHLAQTDKDKNVQAMQDFFSAPSKKTQKPPKKLKGTA